MNRDITKKYTLFTLLKHDLKMFNRYFNQCIGISTNNFQHNEFSKYRVVCKRRGIHQKEMKSDFPSCFVHDGVEIIGTTVVLIKFLPYSGATAQTRSVALWGVSGSYGQAPAQQGMSGLVRETSHFWLYSSPSPSLQPILREPATSILTVLYTFECIKWVATESL